MSAPLFHIPGGTDGPAPVFTLQPPNVPQPTLLDEEITTHDWPLPAVKAWEPAPPPSLFWQIVEALT